MNINDELTLVNDTCIKLKLNIEQYIHLLSHLLKEQDSNLFNYFYDQIPIEYTQEKVEQIKENIRNKLAIEENLFKLDCIEHNCNYFINKLRQTNNKTTMNEGVIIKNNEFNKENKDRIIINDKKTYQETFNNNDNNSSTCSLNNNIISKSYYSYAQTSTTTTNTYVCDKKPICSTQLTLTSNSSLIDSTTTTTTTTATTGTTTTSTRHKVFNKLFEDNIKNLNNKKQTTLSYDEEYEALNLNGSSTTSSCAEDELNCNENTRVIVDCSTFNAKTTSSINDDEGYSENETLKNNNTATTTTTTNNNNNNHVIIDFDNINKQKFEKSIVEATTASSQIPTSNSHYDYSNLRYIDDDTDSSAKLLLQDITERLSQKTKTFKDKQYNNYEFSNNNEVDKRLSFGLTASNSTTTSRKYNENFTRNNNNNNGTSINNSNSTSELRKFGTLGTSLTNNNNNNQTTTRKLEIDSHGSSLTNSSKQDDSSDNGEEYINNESNYNKNNDNYMLKYDINQTIENLGEQHVNETNSLLKPNTDLYSSSYNKKLTSFSTSSITTNYYSKLQKNLTNTNKEELRPLIETTTTTTTPVSGSKSKQNVAYHKNQTEFSSLTYDPTTSATTASNNNNNNNNNSTSNYGSFNLNNNNNNTKSSVLKGKTRKKKQSKEEENKEDNKVYSLFHNEDLEVVLQYINNKESTNTTNKQQVTENSKNKKMTQLKQQQQQQPQKSNVLNTNKKQDSIQNTKNIKKNQKDDQLKLKTYESESEADDDSKDILVIKSENKSLQQIQKVVDTINYENIFDDINDSIKSNEFVTVTNKKLRTKKSNSNPIESRKSTKQQQQQQQANNKQTKSQPKQKSSITTQQQQQQQQQQQKQIKTQNQNLALQAKTINVYKNDDSKIEPILDEKKFPPLVETVKKPLHQDEPKLELQKQQQLNESTLKKSSNKCSTNSVVIFLDEINGKNDDNEIISDQAKHQSIDIKFGFSSDESSNELRSPSIPTSHYESDIEIKNKSKVKTKKKRKQKQIIDQNTLINEIDDSININKQEQLTSFNTTSIGLNPFFPFLSIPMQIHTYPPSIHTTALLKDNSANIIDSAVIAASSDYSQALSTSSTSIPTNILHQNLINVQIENIQPPNVPLYYVPHYMPTTYVPTIPLPQQPLNQIIDQYQVNQENRKKSLYQKSSYSPTIIADALQIAYSVDKGKFNLEEAISFVSKEWKRFKERLENSFDSNIKWYKSN